MDPRFDVTDRPRVTGEVRLEMRMPASREVLFRACSTVEGLEGWYADAVRGRIGPGEPVRLEWPEVGAALDLEVTKVVPNECVVFEGGGTRVTLMTREHELTLVHEGLPEAAVEGLHSSWRVALALLSHGLQWHSGKRRKSHWELRPVRATAELVHLCFTQTEALRHWLGGSTGIGLEGERFSLVLGQQRELSGIVLVQSDGRDVAVSLTELDHSFLSLRTLPSTSPGRYVALCWSTWGPSDPAVHDVRTELSQAMDRLCGLLAQGGAS